MRPKVIKRLGRGKWKINHNGKVMEKRAYYTKKGQYFMIGGQRKYVNRLYPRGRK